MLDFVLQFIVNPQETGAIAASSSELASLITNTADIRNTRTVVEFGPGTGVFSEKILEQISGEALYFALEVNPQFVRETRKRCPDAIVYEDSVTNVKKYLHKHGLQRCDCIISGLPWTTFDRESQQYILHEIIDVLEPGGEFLTFAYVHGLLLPGARRFRRLLHDRFGQVTTTRIVWKNLPPALVYHCIK